MIRVTCIAVLFAVGLLAQAREDRTALHTPVDVSKLGPQVGERVPDFTLTDQNGKTQTLQSIMGARGAMLVFIRSADW
jgi:cytochrome oxidase Cu insertion factor (SCO1/SenC/PrrC family)